MGHVSGSKSAGDNGVVVAILSVHKSANTDLLLLSQFQQQLKFIAPFVRGTAVVLASSLCRGGDERYVAPTPG